jgi:periplasmic copper chaperone A
MSLLIRIIAMLAGAACLAQVAFASDIMVMDAMARASITPVAKTGAVYFTVMNHGAADDKLLSVTTPVANSAEVHETTMDGDVMKMRAVEGGLPVAAGTMVELKPGGFHLMLMGLRSPLVKGESLELELTFEKAGVVKVAAPVGEVAAGHEHGD